MYCKDCPKQVNHPSHCQALDQYVPRKGPVHPKAPGLEKLCPALNETEKGQ